MTVMERRIKIAGNWKMNLTIESAVELANGIKAGAGSITDVDIIVCPPAIAVYPVSQSLKGSVVKSGAQNLYYEKSGAFTGENSADMISSAGGDYVIIGHSERRHVFGESDELIGKKVKSALAQGLIPIVCVGELLEERESNRTEEVLNRQLRGSIWNLTMDELDKVVIAYEPVWAIGTGKVATPAQAEFTHRFIRDQIEKRFDASAARKISILYGGSVKPSNAFELLTCDNVDGALIGGASLKSDSFIMIIEEALKALRKR